MITRTFAPTPAELRGMDTLRPRGQSLRYVNVSNAYDAQERVKSRRLNVSHQRRQLIRHQRGLLIILGLGLLLTLCVVMGACVTVWIG